MGGIALPYLVEKGGWTLRLVVLAIEECRELNGQRDLSVDLATPGMRSQSPFLIWVAMRSKVKCSQIPGLTNGIFISKRLIIQIVTSFI